jgi:hypothetical protein
MYSTVMASPFSGAVPNSVWPGLLFAVKAPRTSAFLVVQEQPRAFGNHEIAHLQVDAQRAGAMQLQPPNAIAVRHGEPAAAVGEV